MLLASKKHTAGDRRRFVIDYCGWLDSGMWVVSATVVSSSATATVDGTQVLEGKQVVFFMNGGNVNESFTVTVTMTDSISGVKKDTIAFMVVAP